MKKDTWVKQARICLFFFNTLTNKADITAITFQLFFLLHTKNMILCIYFNTIFDHPGHDNSMGSYLFNVIFINLPSFFDAWTFINRVLNHGTAWFSFIVPSYALKHVDTNYCVYAFMSMSSSI